MPELFSPPFSSDRMPNSPLKKASDRVIASGGSENPDSGAPEPEPSMQQKYPGLISLTRHGGGNDADARARILSSKPTGSNDLLDYRPEGPTKTWEELAARNAQNRAVGSYNDLVVNQAKRDQSELEQNIVTARTRELAHQKAIDEQAYAADEAARKEAFFRKYGVQYSPQASQEILKYQTKAAIADALAKDFEVLNKMEQESIARFPDKAESIRQQFDQKRRMRLIAMGFQSGESIGGGLNPPKEDYGLGSSIDVSQNPQGGPR